MSQIDRRHIRERHRGSSGHRWTIERSFKSQRADLRIDVEESGVGFGILTVPDIATPFDALELTHQPWTARRGAKGVLRLLIQTPRPLPGTDWLFVQKCHLATAMSALTWPAEIHNRTLGGERWV